jgi:hypothetical protein
MSPDWSAKVVPVPYAKLDNPQSLNLYAYLNNNPLRATDPDGHTDWQQALAAAFGPAAKDALAQQQNASGNAAQKPAEFKFTIDKSVPQDALKCTASGQTFYAPPSFSLSSITSAGASSVMNAFNPSAMNASVGHYGTFDFQRERDAQGNTTFKTAYTPASNLAVGAYLYSAGYTKLGATVISDTFALFKSSNAGDANQTLFRNIGVDLAAGKGTLSCSPVPQN